MYEDLCSKDKTKPSEALEIPMLAVTLTVAIVFIAILD